MVLFIFVQSLKLCEKLEQVFALALELGKAGFVCTLLQEVTAGVSGRETHS